MAHSTLASEIAALTADDDDRNIDFSSASLYLPGLQAVMATVAASSATVLVCALSPDGASSAIRTLVIATCVAAALVRAPIQLSPARGLRIVFAAIRPAPFVYLGCLVCEQLTHTCVSDVTESTRYWRGLLFHACATAAAAAGFARAARPREEQLSSLCVSAIAGCIVALLPPAAVARAGPLCSRPAVGDAVERVCRALLFAALQVSFVYASAPLSNTVADTALCVVRALAASVWVLGVHLYLLTLAPLQLALLAVRTLHQMRALEYEAVQPVEVDVPRIAAKARTLPPSTRRDQNESTATMPSVGSAPRNVPASELRNVLNRTAPRPPDNFAAAVAAVESAV